MSIVETSQPCSCGALAIVEFNTRNLNENSFCPFCGKNATYDARTGKHVHKGGNGTVKVYKGNGFSATYSPTVRKTPRLLKQLTRRLKALGKKQRVSSFDVVRKEGPGQWTVTRLRAHEPPKSVILRGKRQVGRHDNALDCMYEHSFVHMPTRLRLKRSVRALMAERRRQDLTQPKPKPKIQHIHIQLDFPDEWEQLESIEFS